MLRCSTLTHPGSKTGEQHILYSVCIVYCILHYTIVIVLHTSAAVSRRLELRPGGRWPRLASHLGLGDPLEQRSDDGQHHHRAIPRGRGAGEDAEPGPEGLHALANGRGLGAAP